MDSFKIIKGFNFLKRVYLCRMRLDKFLWCVRLAKTRSEASKLCDAGKILLQEEVSKSSKLVSEGCVVSVKCNPIWRTYKVIQMPSSRIGAKLVSLHLIETTDPKDLLILQNIQDQQRENNQLGIKGRPTKKDRRDIDEYRD